MEQLEEMLKKVPKISNPEGDGKYSMKSGTVLIGAKTDNAAVLLADQKASLGSLWGKTRDEEKIKEINDRFAMSITGAASHGTLMAEYLTKFVNQIEQQFDVPATMKTVVQIYRNICQQAQGLQLASLLVGTDENGPHLVEIMADGYFKFCDYSAEGSGAPFAQAILENGYKHDRGTIEYRLTDKLAEKKDELFSLFEKADAVANNSLTAACGIKDEAERTKETNKITKSYRNILMELADKAQLVVPDDSVSYVMKAGITASHQDNANDPAVMTMPPYHVVIAHKSRGLELLDPKEVTLRYNLLMDEMQENRGYTPCDPLKEILDDVLKR